MKRTKRDVIGEGSYGCVHKPSLICKKSPKSTINYNTSVSKIMKLKDAETELKEFIIVHKADSNNLYHLGKPTICEPQLNQETYKNLRDCHYIKINDIKNNPDDYRLLVSKYGGEDLHQFFRYSLGKFVSTNKKEKVDKILLAMYDLLKGLKAFRTHGIVHYDLKPQNILFDETTCKMKYIDFGLMRSKDTVIRESMESSNWLGVYHWSYPFECGLMNQDIFNEYKNKSSRQQMAYFSHFEECIILGKSNAEFDIKSPDSFKTVFTYINPSYTVPDDYTQYGYVYDFFEGINNMIKNGDSYKHILDKIVDSIDIYGLGFTLQFIVNCLKQHNCIDLNIFTNLSSFCKKMYNFNMQQRVTDIDTLLHDFEIIMLENGIISKVKSPSLKQVLKKFAIPKSIVRSQKSISASSGRKTLSKSLEKFAYLDPIIEKTCPEGKEVNPITGRCIKSCNVGYFRNERHRCVKKRDTTKKCLRGKQLNSKTGNCIKNKTKRRKV